MSVPEEVLSDTSTLGDEDAEVKQENVEEDDEEEVQAGGNKKKGRGRGRGGRKKKPTNRFALDDETDVDILSGGLSQVLKGVASSAEAVLKSLPGEEYKQKRKTNLKKFHSTSLEIVGARLKMNLVPETVQQVYEDLELEALPDNLDIDDDQFMVMLEDFQKKAEEALEEEWKGVTPDEVDKEPEYQEVLEVLHEFVERKNKGDESICEEPVDSGAAAAAPRAGPSTSTRGTRRRTRASAAVDLDMSQGAVEALNEFIPTRDPITKLHFEDPYVNKVCGHVYEYASIYALVKKGNPRCPYAGCKNEQPVTVANLVNDPELTKKIKEKIGLEEVD